MQLIGFNGTMGSGKSTAVQVLRDFLNDNDLAHELVAVKFAQPLYDIQEYIYDRINSVYERPQDFIKDRKLLQWIGTDFGRATVGPNIWVDLWKAEVSEALSSYDTFCTTDDCRFDNEAEAIRSLGGLVIKIESATGTERAVQGGIANHASEAGISLHLVDHVVHNDGTLEEYKESLRRLFQSLGLGVQQ